MNTLTRVDCYIRSGKQVIIDIELLQVINDMLVVTTEEDLRESLFNIIRYRGDLDQMFDEIDKKKYLYEILPEINEICKLHQQTAK